MAMVAAAVANDGIAVRPYAVARVFDAEGNTVEEVEPEELGRAMTPDTAMTLTQMMERVVTELGFKGVILNDHVVGETYDDPSFRPFFAPCFPNYCRGGGTRSRSGLSAMPALPA